MANKSTNKRTYKPRNTIKKRVGNNNKRTLKQSAGMQTEPIIVGLVYANWCPHCIDMKPQWNKMKNELQGDNKYNVIEIEADQPDKQERIAELETKLNGKRIDAEGYPTIFKLNNGDVEYYGGNRNANDMKYWATSNQKGGFQIEKQRILNRRKYNYLTPKRIPFAPHRMSKSKSKYKSKSKSKSKSKTSSTYMKD